MRSMAGRNRLISFWRRFSGMAGRQAQATGPQDDGPQCSDRLPGMPVRGSPGAKRILTRTRDPENSAAKLAGGRTRESSDVGSVGCCRASPYVGASALAGGVARFCRQLPAPAAACDDAPWIGASLTAPYTKLPECDHLTACLTGGAVWMRMVWSAARADSGMKLPAHPGT